MNLLLASTDTLAWFLAELGHADEDAYESGYLDVEVVDEEGNEGTTSVNLNNLALAGSLKLKAQELEIIALRKELENLKPKTPQQLMASILSAASQSNKS